jgi:diacylglycerol kinase (ATP)
VTSRRVAVVVNPTAGKGRGADAARQVRAALAGDEVRELVGRDGAEALALCRQAVADGVELLVAVGGDGMAHLALQSVTGTPTALGFVPAGTGNDLARGLGLPLGVAESVARLQEPAIAVDAVRTDAAVWWACVLGAGFDAAVNDRANRMSWPRGRRRYDLAVVAELRSYRPLPFVLTLDGRPREVEAMLVALGNAASYGGGMKVCPGAVMDDGLLDVVVVGPMSRTTFLRLFPRVFAGRHVDHPSVQVHRAASVALTAPRANAYADGEPLGALPVTSTVVPGALRVVGARPGT